MRITTVPPAPACGRRIREIAAITRQIGRMQPTRGGRAAEAAADSLPTFSGILYLFGCSFIVLKLVTYNGRILVQYKLIR